MKKKKRTKRIVYLMRGLPASGKSFEAKRLAGKNGMICETDSFFSELRKKKVPKEKRIDEARKLVFAQFQKAIKSGASPIVVDRGNGIGPLTKAIVLEAIKADYRVEIAEPQSEWWQELRVLINYKKFLKGDKLLKNFAHMLANLQSSTNHVDKKKIFKRMEKYKVDVTLEDIINYVPKEVKAKKEKVVKAK